MPRKGSSRTNFSPGSGIAQAFELLSRYSTSHLVFNDNIQKQDKLLLRAREKHEDMAKNARFEQIWKRRKGKKNSATDGNIHELCNIYDVVRVDDEEKISKKVEQTEDYLLQRDMSLEDSQILCNFMPLLRDYLPEVASEIQSDMDSYINSSEAMMDDYVYDLYAVKD